MGTLKMKKDETLHIRVVQEDKSLIEEAAKFQGLSSSSFMLQNTLEAARRTLAEANRISLSTRDAELFLQALDAPSTANPALEKAFAIHAKRVRKA